MFQREVALRIVATPDKRADYGRLGVLAGWRTRRAAAVRRAARRLHAAAEGDVERRRIGPARGARALRPRDAVGADAGRLRPAPQDAAPVAEGFRRRARARSRAHGSAPPGSSRRAAPRRSTSPDSRAGASGRARCAGGAPQGRNSDDPLAFRRLAFRRLGRRPKIALFAGANETVGVVFRHRATEQIALAEVAALTRKPIEVGLVFDSLGRRLEAQARADLDDGVDQFGPIAALLEIGDIALVDLDLVEAQFAQMLEAGIAGAEVVESNLDAEILSVASDGARCVEVVDQRRFGDLHLEASRLKDGVGEDRRAACQAIGDRGVARRKYSPPFADAAASFTRRRRPVAGCGARGRRSFPSLRPRE